MGLRMKAFAPASRLRSSVSGVALADVAMMVVCDDGRERTREDYGRLFEAGGFKLGRIFEAPTISVIEGVAA